MVLAAFDFDGTITTRDTFLGFLLFSFGRIKVFGGSIALSKTLLLYAVGGISNHEAKERVFSCFFKGMPEDQFDKLCNSYSVEIEKIVRERALQAIQRHQSNKDRVIIVSASVSKWIKPWAVKNGIEVIGTEIEIVNGTLSGKFRSKNCSGIEKVNRLKAAVPNLKDFEIYAYGDTKGDKELLQIADKPFYRTF